MAVKIITDLGFATGRVMDKAELIDILKTNLQPNYVHIDLQTKIVDVVEAM